jgi:hypothetical protein
MLQAIVLSSCCWLLLTGISKQRQAQQPQELQQQQQQQMPARLPGANATGALETSLPFSVSAAVEPPAGTVLAYTCDMLFSTDQVRLYACNVTYHLIGCFLNVLQQQEQQ